MITKRAKVKRPKRYYSNEFMNYLSEGIVGWLMFHKATKRNNIIGELSVYSPIYEIAISQGWNVYTQFPVFIKNKILYIDFIFEKNGIFSVLEIKFLKKNKKFTGNFTYDVRKMVKLDSYQLRENLDKKSFLDEGIGIYRYLMIIGDEKNIKKSFNRNCESDVLKSQFNELIIKDDGGESAQNYRCGIRRGESSVRISSIDVFILFENDSWLILGES